MRIIFFLLLFSSTVCAIPVSVPPLQAPSTDDTHSQPGKKETRVNGSQGKMKLQNFIGGKFVPPKAGKYIDSHQPATGKVHVLVPDSDGDDVEDAYQAANAAFESWSSTTREYRSQMLLKVADILESRLMEFAQAESKDQGKPLKLALTVDIPRAIYNFRYFARKILFLEDKCTVLDGVALNYVQKSPIGVAGLISPWNLPLYLLTWKIAPCIAAGNTCVCKPSEMTSVTAWMLGSVFVEAGLPPGVVNLVFGDGPRAGSAIVKHSKIPLISFTGGTVTGQRIIQDSAPFYKKLSLELGGKNANIIFADCKFEECVATTLRSSFANQGEICLCGSRIFVEESIYDKFIEAFVEKTKELVVGDPNDPKTNMGALVSKAHMEKVLYYIQLGKQEGGQVLCGGAQPDKSTLSAEHQEGYFVMPTIISTRGNQDNGQKELDPMTCRIMQEEIFGPVVTVTPFKTEKDVIEWANGTPYGLSASVWTENGSRQRRVAKELRVGTVWINCWMVRDLNMPFGGVKQSGLGHEGGDYSMQFFMDEKTICLAD